MAPERTARVTIGGETRTVGDIACSEFQGYWTIDVRRDAGDIEAVVLLDGATIKPQWVKISDFGGFTGSAWTGGVGNAVASLAGATFTIAGTAEGLSADSLKPETTNFKIVAECG